MIFDVVTIFPEFFSGILSNGLLKRASGAGLVDIRLHDLRDATDDRHRTVDDRPFGGGPGMVFKPEPLFRAVEALKGEEKFPVILLSPQGRLLNQSLAGKLASESRVALICGRYEGVDERVVEHLATDEISIGDYVLSGGELAAAVVMEAVTRLIPGALGNEESSAQDSFNTLESEAGRGREKAAEGAGLLDFPHYTRPADFRGWKVPEILLSGNHQEIRQWRRRRSLEKTWRRRPDLLAGAVLSEEDREILDEIKRAACAPTAP
ncbi:MAG: tRNA (guanosine(37)-N1)-methyltransferase TrmD [Deltaproteobacteria bacterium]